MKGGGGDSGGGGQWWGFIIMQRRSLRGLLAVILLAMAASILALLCTDMIALLCSPLFLLNASSSSPAYYSHELRPSDAAQQSVPGITRDPQKEALIDHSIAVLSGNTTWSDENLHSAAASTTEEGGKAISPSIREAKKEKRCNYYEGRWVKGKKRKPLYSGSSCKRWLSGMWACREMKGRKDFDYEEYVWKPHGCSLPSFNSHDFLHRMRNKVVAFVGDSIGRQQYQSLMCMLTGGEDSAEVEDISRSYGLVKPRGAIRADGTAQRFVGSNTTVLYYWSATLCELRPLNKSDKNTDYALNLDRPVAFLQKYVRSFDVLVLNTGHHWNRGKMSANKWVMYSGGRPISHKQPLFRDLSLARNFSVHHLAAWLHEQRRSRHTAAEIFIRSLSPRHFFGGDWNSGGRCDDNSVPVEKRNMTGRPLTDPSVESALRGTSVRLLNVTYISQFRDEAHISKYRPNQNGQDCLHWCMPGVPDVWNELLYAEILSERKEVAKGVIPM